MLSAPSRVLTLRLLKGGGIYCERVLIYGTGEKARNLIGELHGKGIVGILDRVKTSGDVLGIPILKWEDIQVEMADALIIASKPQFHMEIYNRIANQCIQRGLAVFLFGE